MKNIKETYLELWFLKFKSKWLFWSLIHKVARHKGRSSNKHNSQFSLISTDFELCQV